MFSFPLFVAKRYFFSKKKQNFINKIAWLSMVGVAVSSAALIIVLSVFNGLESLMQEVYSAFDPPLKIVHVVDKSFEVTPTWMDSIRSVKNIEEVTEVIEDNAYAKYKESEMVITLKGVSEHYFKQSHLNDYVLEKSDVGNSPSCWIGRGVQYSLSLSLEDSFFPLQLYYLPDVKKSIVGPTYKQQNIYPTGVFSIEQNFDNAFVIVPIQVMQQLTKYDNRRTALEITIKENAEVGAVQQELKNLMGKEFKVLTNEEQHADLYRLLKVEKLVTAMSLLILVVIAAVNIFMFLMMMILDKKKDFLMLVKLGATPKMIQRIIVGEGIIIALYGVIVGLVLGGGFCALQQYVGLMGMGFENSMVSDYPMKIHFSDFVFTFMAVVLVSGLVSLLPAQIAKKHLVAKEMFSKTI